MSVPGLLFHATVQYTRLVNTFITRFVATNITVALNKGGRGPKKGLGSPVSKSDYIKIKQKGRQDFLLIIVVTYR